MAKHEDSEIARHIYFDPEYDYFLFSLPIVEVDRALDEYEEQHKKKVPYIPIGPGPEIATVNGFQSMLEDCWEPVGTIELEEDAANLERPSGPVSPTEMCRVVMRTPKEK